MIHESVLETIGNTPLIHAARYEKALELKATLLVKMESRNPGGSVKDRAAFAMLSDALSRGVIAPGGTVIEVTSGNTGVSLSMAAAVLGLHVVLAMPESMSVERRKLQAAFGATLVLTPTELGMAGAKEKAEEIAKETPNSFLVSQFENPANPRMHEQTTGPEIWRDTEGKVDALVACVGTGGTVSGTARYLKGKQPLLKAFAVEPKESPLLSGGKAGPHGIQGAGANFVPDNYDAAVVDEVLCVSTEQAMETARDFAKIEGILCGISAGAALFAAVSLARRSDFFGKRIVVILPDTGERYLTTTLYE